MQRICGLFATAAVAAAIVAAIGRAAPAGADEFLVYIGTYTGTGSPEARSAGIYVARFRAATSEATEPVVAAETDNPSFLAIHPNRRFLYAANESGERSGVSAFAIDPASGKLRLLNRVASARAIVYISVHGALAKPRLVTRTSRLR